MIESGLAAFGDFGNASEVIGKRFEICRYPQYLDIVMQPEYLDNFRSLMTFRDDIWKIATHLFHNMACPPKKASTSNPCHTMISVHMRMGDYPIHMKFRFGTTDFSHTNYLQNAVRYLATKYHVCTLQLPPISHPYNSIVTFSPAP